jgi:hypothetical protein
MITRVTKHPADRLMQMICGSGRWIDCRVDCWQAVMSAESTIPTQGRMLTYLVGARLSATQIVVAYADSEAGSVLVADVAGDVVTPGSPITIAASKPLSLSLSALSPASFLISFYTK